MRQQHPTQENGEDSGRPTLLRTREVFIALASSIALTCLAAMTAHDNHPNPPHAPITHRQAIHGFTLIEMSIVLVVIGLIVGGGRWAASDRGCNGSGANFTD